MRSPSATSLTALLAQETGEVFILLATITHPLLANPINICSDTKPVISSGVWYAGWSFNIQFPADDVTKPPAVNVTIDNIDPSIGAALQSIVGAVAALIELQI